MKTTTKRITSSAVAALAAVSILGAGASGASAATNATSAKGTDAVAGFQADHGLAPTGTINEQTGRALQQAPQAEVRSTFKVAADLPPAQLANARTVIGVGKALKVPTRGIEIALMTAMTESKFVNYTDAVDHDSLGIFQQRPSSGWGTAGQITNVAYSTSLFFGLAPTGSAPGLYQVPNWETLARGVAAQTVQVSAFPDRYAEFESWAIDFLATEGPNSPPVTPPAPPA